MKKKNFNCLILSIAALILVLGIVPLGKSISSHRHKKEKAKEEVNKDLLVREEELYNQIEAYANQYEIPPIDAKIDPVWKAIPGYNGKGVNIAASYEEMKKTGAFDEKRFIYREMPPKIHLEDLEPQPIYRGNPEKPMVAFLINVAWGNEFIPAILETLEAHQIKTTFFFDGSWVENNPDMAKLIHAAGHEIGNHAYTHPNLESCSRDKTVEELKKTNNIIEETLGVKPIFFAPPSGSFNQVTVEVAHELGMKTILWTVDTVDWRKPESSEMVKRVLSKIEKGSMVLMHPTKPTAEGLDGIIRDIKERGYHLGTVTDLMSEKRL